MPEKDIADALFELKDKERNAKTRSSQRVQRPKPLPLIKRRSFDTFYLFSASLLLLALIVQLIAIATYG